MGSDSRPDRRERLYDGAIVHRSRIPIFVAAMLALFVIGVAPAAAEDHFTPLSARVLHAPEPLRGGDGREHLVYELVVSNESAFPPPAVTVRKVVATAAGKPIEPGAKAPRVLDHELVVSPGPPGSVELSRLTVAPTAVVRRPAPIVAPPLRGPGWVVVNGCCDENTSHRRSLLAIDGALHEGERYAIDFVQMTPAGRIAEGSNHVLGNYPFYGDQVLSATAGEVVGVVDRLPDGPIDFELPPREAGDAGGNHVVVAMGGGRYAFYAHLQPGSIRVKIGQRVRPGDVLGLLGNSGDSNAPHLHFQLMDGPSPLGSEGIPYRFSAFTAEGTLTNFPRFFVFGDRAKLAGAPRGPERAELPLNLQVIGFGP